MNRKTWIAFSSVQSLGLLSGLLSSWVWSHEAFGVPPITYATALFLLLPGDLVSGVVVGQIFWNSGITLKKMGMIEISIILTLNLCVWYCCSEGRVAITDVVTSRKSRGYNGIS